MAYTVLARRYRSGTFDEVVGQGHVAQTLKRAIESGRIAHAYLFCGTRGVGKTSMARILAKALNCRASDQPTTEPCGKCDSCLAIARGDDMDVIEIDAASNTQVDRTREVIIDNVSYRPANSRFKIFIIDEVHMLSKSSFNALLKTLEEPPSHVKFILATTETEKIPNTILSRCQRYDFRNIPTREIAAHLKEVTKSEKLKADEEALMLIAKAGAGSMRDALSLLDRLLSVGEKNLTVDMVEGLLGLPKSQLIFDLAQSIGEGDTRATLTKSNAMIDAGQSADGLVSSLVDHLRNLLIAKTCGIDSELVEVPGLSPEEIQQQAEKFDAVALSQDIAILEELRRQMRSSSAGRALLDATLVRLALADQFASIADLLSGNGSTSGGGAPARRTAASTAPAQKKNDSLSPATPQSQHGQSIATESAAAPPRVFEPATSSTNPPTPTPSTSPSSDDEDDDLPRPGKVWDSSGPSLSELLKMRAGGGAAVPAPQAAPVVERGSAAATIDSNIEAVDPADLPGVWQALMQKLSEKGPGLLSLLSHGKYVGVIDGRATIRYAPQHETFVKLFERNGKKDTVRDAISTVLQQNIGVCFEVDGAMTTATETSREPAAAPVAKPQAAVMRSVPTPAPAMPMTAAPLKPTPDQIAALRESDELIRTLMDEFSAQVIKIE